MHEIRVCPAVRQTEHLNIRFSLPSPSVRIRRIFGLPGVVRFRRKSFQSTQTTQRSRGLDKSRRCKSGILKNLMQRIGKIESV